MRKSPSVTETISFEQQPITGLQIAALARRVAGSEFAVYYDGDGLFNFGADVWRPFEDIRVIPQIDGLPFFDANGTYSGANVTSHSWDDETTFEFGRAAAVDAVKEFAAKLRKAYKEACHTGFLPEYIEPRGRSEKR